MAQEVQDICDELVEDDPSFTDLELDLDEIDDEGIALIVEAMRKNTHVLKVFMHDGTLSVRAALALAPVLERHPACEKVDILHVDMIEFSAIALAFQQNEKLSHLAITGLEIKPGMNECLRSLLASNALASLSIKYCKCQDGHDIDLSGALGNNSSLTELVLRGGIQTETIFSPETVRDVPRLIRANRSIRMIDLRCIRITYGGMFLIASVVEQHSSLEHLSLNRCCLTVSSELCEAFAMMLQNARSLRYLDLTGNRMEPAGVQQLAKGLQGETSVLKELRLEICGIEDVGATHLARGLEVNQTLRELSLNFNSIGDAGTSALASALEKTSALENLSLEENEIGPKGATDLAGALCSNQCLKVLNVGGNPFGEDAVRSIAQMLTSNTALETLRVGNSDSDVDAFVEYLPEMSFLKTLDLSWMSTVTTDTMRAFLGALERNTVLKEVYLDTDGAENEDEFLSKLEHILTLNHGGRRILKSRAVPPALWPRVLGRSSDEQDVLFFFLREKPDALIGKMTTRKRKRGDSDLDD